MKYRKMGRTGLQVSELCLGCMTFGPGLGFMKGISTPEKRAVKILDRAVERGINFLDLADVYQEGICEEIVGKWMHRRKNRGALVVATKVRGRTGPGPNDEGLSRAHVVAACEASLRRLRTETIDLYQVHWPDPEVPLEETLEALTDLRRAGKIRYAGCSNFPAWYLTKALWASDAGGGIRFDCLQPQYNLAVRHIERELLPLCRDQVLGVIPWSPLAAGLLSGKHQRSEFPFRHSRLASWVERYAQGGMPRVWSIIDAVRGMAAKRGVPPAAVALSWANHQPGITACIIGVRTQVQLEENLSAVELELTPDEVKRLDKVSALPPEYPSEMMNRMLAGGPAWE
jgi:aryl-alcohol dehydrogenase-like predicted oxidoreductase